jgi:L-ribulokinase
MKCTIGLDFGTLSVRGVLVDIATGNIIEHCVSYYKHGVMDEYLNNDIKLPKNFALQNANDYIESMKEVVINIIDKMKIKKDDIIGIGVDFTSSTILPITKDGLPLSNLTEFKDNPHAYVKLWKHHSAEEYAIKITNLAIDLNEPWIKRYVE